MNKTNEHLQEKSSTLEQKGRRKSYAQLNKMIYEGVYESFPELKALWDPYSQDPQPAAEEKLAEILFVLKYFASHPRVLSSLQSGSLQMGKTPTHKCAQEGDLLWPVIPSTSR